MRTWVFALSFILSALAFTWLAQQRPQIKAKYFSRIEVSTGGYHHLFVGARLGRSDKKFLIDPARDPKILPSLFPGYEIAGDHNLWRNYFFREFEIKLTSAYLSEGSDYGMVVYHSFTGCFDILSRYGADILVVGASDLAQDIPPDELAKYFPGAKILACAAPTLTPDGIVETLNWIKRIYPAAVARPRAVVIGLSRTTSYIASPFYEALTQAKTEQLRHYKQADFLGRYAYLNQAYRLPFTWNVLFPIRRDANHLPLVNRLVHPERWSLLDIHVSLGDYLKNPKAFEERRRVNPQRSSIFTGVADDPSCLRLARLPELLGRLKASALEVGDSALVFTTPTMGDELREAPACYLIMYDEVVASLRDRRTTVINEGLPYYGLTALDFAFQDSKRHDQRLVFDVAHPNYGGARKITEAIARELKGRMAR